MLPDVRLILPDSADNARGPHPCPSPGIPSPFRVFNSLHLLTVTLVPLSTYYFFFNKRGRGRDAPEGGGEGGGMPNQPNQAILGNPQATLAQQPNVSDQSSTTTLITNFSTLEDSGHEKDPPVREGLSLVLVVSRAGSRVRLPSQRLRVSSPVRLRPSP